MLIVIAHGSRDPRWRASVERVVASLADEPNGEGIRLAYMELTPPTLMDVAVEAARSGAKSLRVLPLFLAAEGHVERNVEPLVQAVREALEGVEVTLLAPVGQQPEFREALRGIANRTQRRDSS